MTDYNAIGMRASDGQLIYPSLSDRAVNIFSGTSAQYVRGDGSLASFPAMPSAFSFNNSPGRSLVTATNQTGFQISSTRNAFVAYEGVIQTTSTIGGPSSGSVFLEIADTNSTTPGDWTVLASQTSSQTITLAVALQSVDGEAWSLARIISAGKWVRIRSATNAGSVSVSINSTQQEVMM